VSVVSVDVGFVGGGLFVVASRRHCAQRSSRCGARRLRREQVPLAIARRVVVGAEQPDRWGCSRRGGDHGDVCGLGWSRWARSSSSCWRKVSRFARARGGLRRLLGGARPVRGRGRGRSVAGGVRPAFRTGRPPSGSCLPRTAGHGRRTGPGVPTGWRRGDPELPGGDGDEPDPLERQRPVTVAAPTNTVNATRPNQTGSARSTAPTRHYVVILNGG
jgi:hypothetical protein